MHNHHRIKRAVKLGRGIRLSPKECVSIAQDGDMRMLGVLDGTVHALINVRNEINSLAGRYSKKINPHHTQLIARRDAILAPLKRLEKYLDKQIDAIKAAYDTSCSERNEGSTMDLIQQLAADAKPCRDCIVDQRGTFCTMNCSGAKLQPPATPTILVTAPQPSTWAYPVKSSALRISAIKTDICPECGAALDTGFECNDCGFDAAKERAEYLAFIKAR